MIFYGTRSSSIQNGVIKNVECPHCQSNTEMNYSIFGKYAHIYWIPLFPIKKLTVAECNSCKRTFELKDLSPTIKNKLNNSTGKLSNPLWMFSGLFIIGALFLFGYFSAMQTASNSKIFVQDPKIGDVYFVKESNGFYTTMKVDEVSKDSVVVFLNEMEIDKKSKIDKIDLDKNYKTKERISKKNIQKLFNETKIYEVLRH